LDERSVVRAAAILPWAASNPKMAQHYSMAAAFTDYAKIRILKILD
jgi:hypothetical protein